MATRTLTNGQTTLADGAWSATPADDDRLEIREGNQIITSALTAQEDEDLLALWVGPQFTGSLGSPAGSASFLVSSASGTPWVYLLGRSDVYLTTPAGGIDNLEINKDGGIVSLTGGAYVNVFVYSGDVTIGGSAVVTNLYVFGGNVTINDNATAPTLVVHMGGTVRTDRDVATYTLNGGHLYAEDATGMTTLNVFSGTANLRSTGTFGTVNFYGGHLTPAGSLTDVTITALNVFGAKGQGVWIDEAAGVMLNTTVTYTGNNTPSKG